VADVRDARTVSNNHRALLSDEVEDGTILYANAAFREWSEYTLLS